MDEDRQDTRQLNYPDASTGWIVLNRIVNHYKEPGKIIWQRI